MKLRLSFFVSVFLPAVMFSTSLPAQEVTAGIYGIVQDSSGAVLPGGEIVLHNLDTGRKFQSLSDASGNFILTLIPPGKYEASAELPGFKKSVVTDIILRVNDRQRIVFTLQVGEIAESITVQASTVAVETATGTTSNFLGSEDIINLPTVGRNVMPFAMIMPGVVSDNPNSRRDNR